MNFNYVQNGTKISILRKNGLWGYLKEGQNIISL
ncbi:hypothetical protein ES319_A09G258700v1 [Gossypium barbadense]|uniref:WG repeat-containing protein n=1 Tax=Gossypium barbadense TaxID=3634 RepID=A0A5J5UJ77_GOSBA|nr:hypothetical protein ES319_A09G258700v1 [Gossypium barbadense]